MRLAILLNLIAASLASANDGPTLADHLGQLRFYKETQLSMESEILAVDLAKRSVEVDYVFKNPTPIDVSIDVGFPLPSCDYDDVTGPNSHSGCADWSNGTQGKKLQNMRLWVNGLPDSQGKWLVTLHDGAHELLLAESYAELPSAVSEYCNPSKQAEITESQKCDADATKRAKAILKSLGLNPDTDWDSFSRFKMERVYKWKMSVKAGQSIQVRHLYDARLNVGGPSNSLTADEFKKLKNLDALDWLVSAKAEPEGRKNGMDKVCSGEIRTAIKAKIDHLKENQRVNFASFEYVLKTGGLWNGPIKDFTLRVKKPPGEILTTCFPGLAKTKAGDFVSHKTNFRPTGDLALALIEDARY